MRCVAHPSGLDSRTVPHWPLKSVMGGRQDRFLMEDFILDGSCDLRGDTLLSCAERQGFLSGSFVYADSAMYIYHDLSKGNSEISPPLT